jgi:hypothetical protein
VARAQVGAELRREPVERREDERVLAARVRAEVGERAAHEAGDRARPGRAFDARAADGEGRLEEHRAQALVGGSEGIVSRHGELPLSSSGSLTRGVQREVPTRFLCGP